MILHWKSFLHVIGWYRRFKVTEEFWINTCRYAKTNSILNGKTIVPYIPFRIGTCILYEGPFGSFYFLTKGD